MRNLDGWAGLINTDILCVVSESNIDAAHELIDTLADKGYAKKRVRMLFSPISPTYDNETIAPAGNTPHPELLAAETEIAAAITQLTIHAAQRGLIADLRPDRTWCAVIRANGQNITITPDGCRFLVDWLEPEKREDFLAHDGLGWRDWNACYLEVGRAIMSRRNRRENR